MACIHPSAVVEEGASLGSEVSVGPFCHVGANVILDDNVVLYSHVVVEGHTTIGAQTRIHAFASIGGPPQHLGYRGDPTRLTVGADNIIREHVTMNIGTPEGRGETIVGDSNVFMTAAHVAHDCVIGDNVVMANNATLGGHVTVGDFAFLGGLCAIHQNCRVGAHAFVGGCAAAPTDIIPFGSATGNHAKLSGLNIVGMKRRGVNRKAIHAVRAAYRDLFASGSRFTDRVDAVAQAHAETPEVMAIVEFIRADAKRAIMTPEG